MNKIWKLKPKIPADLVSIFQDHNPLLTQLLYNRNLTEAGQISEFLEPQYERLHSPFLFKDMEKAVQRIWQAINNNEKITIFGDYDADAVTANAVLRQTFRYLNYENIESYIPDRFSEGYGVNLEAVSKIIEQGTRVIITVDCGTNSVEVAAFCKNNGVDFIITDHHEIIGDLPEAYALINPKNPNDNYPYTEITGVGVAFKLACGILKRAKGQELSAKESHLSSKRLAFSAGVMHGWEKWLLDLVAIGTVADCHELLGENRVLVKFGLMVLTKTKWIGLKALIASSRVDFKKQLPDVYTLGFIIAPRLNAAGRLEHANTALELLLETDFLKAKAKAEILENINLRRQETTALILSEAREKALMIKDRKVIALMNTNWHKGVVGLVAGKLAEEFYKPVFVLSEEESEATGSARTVGEFNVVEALQYSSTHLIRFGGHKQAAGLSLKPHNFELFYSSVLKYADEHLPEESLSRVLEFEAELEPEHLQLTTYSLITSLEPFGVGNPKPKFLIRNVQIASEKVVGASGQHLQMQIKIGDKVIPAIAFNFKKINSSSPIDIACELMEDAWNGRKQLKLRIIDVKFNQNSIITK